ncbi:hypothetical protein FHR22_004076 [Sphingopyxis panaciterrae]|uniref:hypothetical protein n=1 Tax=Sphingopyxis panaciterrae TaxID=363841 RepID=UPI00141F2570|nr:hypothetical protein [Sphingopyxis panaciterrae]NIJ39329.1 hypothetical protein [Sphingopyxis panaciterrae]
MEARLKKLEKTIEQQGYLLLILMVLLIVDTAALLILWGEKGKPDFDHIAVSLTVFQTLFGIAALYGFWALRGLTIERAEDVAEAEVKKIAPPLILREVQDSLQNLPRDTISDADLNDIVIATGDAGKEGDDGK